MECPNCHTINDEDALFCKKCGTRLIVQENEEALLPSVVEPSTIEEVNLTESSEIGPVTEKTQVLSDAEVSETKKAKKTSGLEYMDPDYVEPKVINLKGGSWWWVLAWPVTVLVIFVISFLFVWIQTIAE